MRRTLARDTKIARRIDNSGAEVRFPDAIDDHARADGLLQDCFRQFQPATAFRERRRRSLRQNRDEPARDLVARIKWIPSNTEVQVDGFLGVLYCVQKWIFRVQLLVRGV